MKADRGCVILAGASFRDGGQGSSNVDTENSRNFQNPLYRMCGRDEQPNKNKTSGCYGEIFDKYKVPVGKFKDYHLYNK